MIFALISRKKKMHKSAFSGNIGLLRRGVAHPCLDGGLRQGVARLRQGVAKLRRGLAEDGKFPSLGPACYSEANCYVEGSTVHSFEIL